MKKIAFISQPEYFRFVYEHDLDAFFEVREFSFDFKTTAAIWGELVAYRADYYIFFRGEYFPDGVLERLGGIKIALSSEPFPRLIGGKWGYTLDSLRRYREFRQIRRKRFDYVFHYDAASLPLFARDGLSISGEFVLPVACQTYRYEEKKEKKAWDIFFIGRSTVHRERFFGPLKHHFNFLHIAHGIWGPGLVEYLGKSTICLNIHAEDERSWEPRLQMLLATGAFVISEPITPNEYLKPGRDFIECSTPRDLYEKVRYYLAHAEEREKIASTGRETVRSRLSSQQVFSQLIKDIEQGVYNRFSVKKKNVFVSVPLYISLLIDRVHVFRPGALGSTIFRIIKNVQKEYKRNGLFGIGRRIVTHSIFRPIRRLYIIQIVQKSVNALRFLLKEYRRTGVRGVWRRVSWGMLSGQGYFPVPYNEREWVKMKRRLRSGEEKRQKILAQYKSRIPTGQAKKKVLYVVPGLAISGGIAIILNHVNRLQARGYEVMLVSLNKVVPITWFRNSVPVVSVHELSIEQLALVDLVVATHWSTAFFVDLLPVKRKAYFVQSDERRFNPDRPDEQATIEATYRLPFEYVTEARWIQRWLKSEFGHRAAYVPNGLNESFFAEGNPLSPRSPKKLRILLEGPLDSWFKGMSEAYRAVAGLDIELWIVSSSGKPPTDWKYDRFFANVPIDDMRDIYASCDIFVKLSQIEGFFGPPLEAMACGCAVVVGKVTGYDEYIVDGENALVVEPGDVVAARAAVVRLMDDRVLRERLIVSGRKTAQVWQWDHSINRLEKFVRGESWEESVPDGGEGQNYDYPTEMSRLFWVQEEWQRNYF